MQTGPRRAEWLRLWLTCPGTGRSIRGHPAPWLPLPFLCSRRAAFQAHHPSFHLAALPQTLPFMPPTASPYKLSTLQIADPNTPSTSPSPSQHGPGESTQPTSWVSPTLPFLWVCGNLTPLLSTSFSSSRGRNRMLQWGGSPRLRPPL